MRVHRVKAWFLAGFIAAIGLAASPALAQSGSGGSVADGAGIRDALTGAKHPGLKNWRGAPTQSGEIVMRRNTLLPPAQIGCAFASGLFHDGRNQTQACAVEPGAQPLPEAVATDGRKGALCVAGQQMQVGYRLRYQTQFPASRGPDTVVTCLVAADVQPNALLFGQHEKEVRAFLAGVTIPGEALEAAPIAPVAKGPGGAVANTHADRVAAAVLAAAGDGPLTQATLPSLRKRIPMVKWTGGGGEMLAAGTFEGGDVYIEDLGRTAPGLRFLYTPEYGKASLSQVQLLKALVARGAQVDRHACFSQSSMFNGVMTQDTRDFIRVRNAAGRAFLVLSWTEKPARGVETVKSIEVETAAALLPASHLDTYGRTPASVPCPAWTPIDAPAPVASAAAPKPTAPPVAKTEADRFAEIVLAAAGSAPLKQVTAAALKARLPQVKNWEYEDFNATAFGTIDNFQFTAMLEPGGAAAISMDAMGPPARGSRSLPAKDALRAALVARGAKVDRHHCTQLFMTAERLTMRSDHLRVALAGGRQFLLTVSTNIRDARSEEVAGLTVRTAASLPTAASLNAIFGSGTKLQACQ